MPRNSEDFETETNVGDLNIPSSEVNELHLCCLLTKKENGSGNITVKTNNSFEF